MSSKTPGFYHRKSLRKKAAERGIGTKAYRSIETESVRWTHVVGTVRRRCAKSGIECKLVPADVKKIFYDQQGLCPITGWELLLPKSGLGLKRNTITVDRIDQSLGYILGNVRLISFAANNARYRWDDQQLLALAEAIIRQHKNPRKTPSSIMVEDMEKRGITAKSRVASWKTVSIICEPCGDSFLPTRKRQAYCSHGCASAAKAGVVWPDDLVEKVKMHGVGAVAREIGVTKVSVYKRLRRG